METCGSIRRRSTLQQVQSSTLQNLLILRRKENYNPDISFTIRGSFPEKVVLRMRKHLCGELLPRSQICVAWVQKDDGCVTDPPHLLASKNKTMCLFPIKTPSIKSDKINGRIVPLRRVWVKICFTGFLLLIQFDSDILCTVLNQPCTPTLQILQTVDR